MNEAKLELLWSEIPIGKENAVTYDDLCHLWNKDERTVRSYLHQLSRFDNGDDYILVRSASGKGFYRTDVPEIIKAYRQECLNKGKSIFAPVKKINRVLNNEIGQVQFENNLRLYREAKNLTQKEVCDTMKLYDSYFDNSLLSKMENGVCLPTPYQTALLAKIYDVSPSEIINTEYYI